jgi:predicted Zn-dependent peptidase
MNLQTRPFQPGKAFILAFFLVFSSLAPLQSRAQGVPEPKRERLLNGLRVLLWVRPGSPDVTLKLRIHSGAAFDLADKAGTMALLGDSLFPDPTTREFITGELKGSLEVVTDYDAINVTLAGRAAEFERIVDLLRAALVNPLPQVETVAKLREARVMIVRETGIAPGSIADRAAASRLFGAYPYGRAVAGDADSLPRIERTDLLFARERFLNPDNATLVVTGGVDERRAMRALRQLLGAWRKGDKAVPTTFRQPDAPDTRTLMIDLPGAETAEIRLATRGLARSDADYPAATLLALLVRDRWQAALPELGKSAFFVRHDAHVLPGIFMLGAAVHNRTAASTLRAARNVLRALANSPPTATELERVRSEAAAVFNRRTQEDPASLSEMWLDMETYKLAPIDEQARALSLVTPADLQRTAARLFRDASMASVVVGSAVALRADLERLGRIEISGEAAVPKAAPGAGTPTKTP